ncbi:hypothetical protein MPTK1_7g01560 [Marchantia polymorpha subsp. ruderalis]|uniref:RRM domain-containing protein n=2 Tax=Marchantia polymorpha TaxID=3197 RepID=A0AAF6BV32_MARPO|nr:hypothetical protein MARPO_0099s0031 [Marchantia polymorpha]BBN15866.1 hypothetical protein Mp_7g01560 [Marchantia polymorpha subsp. ruderalis]|eukprot:PTQ32394.1 hypothetical protein MARPO_0099s0031 [Marchantia polymorpha]
MAAPPAQYAQWSAPAPPADTSHDEVRTIFVLGFPPDVKERELQNLLRWWPGYEASQMNFKGDQPMGFALFSTAAMAMAARDALQNLVFDSETNSVLRAEMAKKNLYVKRGGSEPATYDPSKRMRTGGDYSAPQYAAPSAFVPPAAPTWGPQSYIPPSAPYDPYGGYSVAQVPPVAPAGYAPVQNTKDNPPCNTLFIGNLGEATSEAELRGLFSGQPGFRQMKVLRQGKSTVCFIEFGDVSTAMSVHQNLQGAVLTTSDRGGMRIQYSKNPYGRKREGMGTGAQQSDGVVAPTQASQVKLETTPATAVPELNGGPEIALAPVLPPPSSVKSEQPQAV